MRGILRASLDVIRGALIGAAEVIPGVSGGTIALIVGVYETLIRSAGHLVRGFAALVVDGVRGRGTVRARGHLGQVRWSVVLPVLVGMAIAVVAGAAVLAPLIDRRPVETRAVFAGLILASLIVPVRMAGRWRPWHVLLALVVAVGAFVLVGLPPGNAFDPPLPLVAIAAAVAVCALVLPGVSGSFLLLALGLYAPTLAAVNARDLGYLAVFALGAVGGLALFVPLLQWLLEHRRTVTLVVMTGLMLGSLRALWPWQSDDRAVHAPVPEETLPIAALVLAGAAVVVVLLLIERRLRPSGAAEAADEPSSHTASETR